MDVGGEGHLAERAGRRALGPAGRGLLLGLAYGGRRLRTSLYPTRWARLWVAELGREVQPLSWECVAFLEGPSGWPRRLEVLHGGLRSILLAHESPCACLFPTLCSVMSPSSLESTSGRLCTTEIGKHCRSELSSFQGASLPAHQPLQLRRWLQLDSNGPRVAGPGDSLFSLFAEGFRKTVSSTLPDLRKMKQAQNLSS